MNTFYDFNKNENENENCCDQYVDIENDTTHENTNNFIKNFNLTINTKLTINAKLNNDINKINKIVVNKKGKPPILIKKPYHKKIQKSSTLSVDLDKYNNCNYNNHNRSIDADYDGCIKKLKKEKIL